MTILRASTFITWLMLLSASVIQTALAAEVASLQRGNVQSTGAGVATVALAQSVDPSRSVLFFSSRHDSDRPVGSMLRGTLTAASVSFERVSNESSLIDINWTVVEFASGVQVQRGTFNMTSSNQNVTLAQSVADPGAAFVLWSKTPVATDRIYSQDDPVGGRLLNSSTLRFSAGSANRNHLIAYQVVEFTNPGDVVVQSGSTRMSNGATSLDINLSAPVNPATSLVLAGYSSNGSGNQIARRMLNATLLDADTVQFRRERSGSGILDVVWQVVEFRDGTTVQSGLETFTPGETTRTVSLAATVDPGSAVAFSSMQPVGGLNMGSSSYISNDIVGTGSYTFDLGGSTLAVQRSNSLANSTVGWSVVSFGNLESVLRLQMDELSWDGTPGEVVDSVSGLDGVALNGADTAAAAPAVPGNPGTCRYGEFDGVDDHVLVPHDPSLNGSSALTYSAWIYPRSWSGLRQVMSKSVHGGGSGRAQMGIFSESNRLTLRAETNAGRRDLRVSLPTLDAWSHVAGVFTGDSLELYVNGVLAGATSFSATTLRSTTDPLAISKRVGSPRYYFDGFIDEVGVHTTALDGSDVTALMMRTQPCPSTPIGQWHLDEFGWNGTPGEVIDYSGNDYNGTANNVVTRLGRVCKAANMVADGTEDYLVLDNNAFDSLDDFTIALWYRGPQTGQMAIVSGANSSQFNELIFFFDRTDRFRPYLRGRAGGRINAPGAMDGNWHFLVWTRAGTSNCLYMDDVLMGCTSLPTGTISIDPGGLIIGQEQDRLGGGFVRSQDVQGDLDELLLFDSALSQAELVEIRANHIAGLNWDGSERVCPVTGAAGFVLNHDGAGIHCLAEPVTVSAVDFASVLVPSYVNEITLQTSTGEGNWSLANGFGVLSDTTPDDGRATYFFSGSDDGSAVFRLDYPSGPAVVDVDVFQSDDITVRDNDAEGVLRFAPSGFTVTQNVLANPPPSPIDDPLLAQTAGVGFPMHIAAYGITDDDPECGVIESYAGSRSVKFAMTHDNPGSGSRVVVVDGTAAAGSLAAASVQPVNFVAGQAQVALNYKDVGEISVQLEDDVSFPAPLSGGSNSFVVKPAALEVSLVEGAAGEANPGAATMSADRFVPAAQAFVVEVAAVDADGDITPNFGLETPPETVVVSSPGLIAPTGGRHGSAGDVTNGASFSLSSTPGVLRNSSISFDEVGIISLLPGLADDDYLGSGSVTGNNSGNVGRFYPAAFELSGSSVSNACGMFTYMDQPALSIRYEVAALNAADDVTLNYDAADLSVPVATVELLAEDANDGVERTSRLNAAGGQWDDGEYVVDLNNVSFARLGTPDGPFESLQLSVAVDDPQDPVTQKILDSRADTTGDCALAGDCDAAAIGTPAQLVYGRLLVLPSFGPENLDLGVGLEAQRFADGVFRSFAADVCSLYSASRTSLSSFTGNLAAGETTVTLPAADTALVSGMADGDNPLQLSAPGFGNDGAVEVQLDVDAWLEFDWQGTGLEDPRGIATFGRYRGHDRIIFWREGR